MYSDYIEFDTPYGPAYVVYRAPEQWEIMDDFTATKNVTVSQVLVQCPKHIVWDSNGMWYPSPRVVDYVLPRARAVCELLGVPAYEWLREVRRDEIWAIEQDFSMNKPVSMMMEFSDSDDYDKTGRYSAWT